MEAFLERNANLLEQQVESYWNEGKKPIWCDACLNEKFRKEIAKVDRLLTPVAVATLCFCVFCIVFFPLFVWFLEAVLKPIFNGVAGWIATAIASILVFLLFLRTMRPFKEMWRKIK